MKLFVRLYKDVTGTKPVGLPDDWPAVVDEVDDATPDPSDGRLVMKDDAELKAYMAARQSSYDAWKDVVTLPEKKEAKFTAIDARTQELIAAGFVFTAKTFSLSAHAQSTFTGLYAIRDEAALVFPVRVNTIDDADFYDLKDSAEVRDFYLAAVGTYRAHLDSGTALKDQVRAATTAAEVDAVDDKR